MGFSMHDTILRAGTETHMWYRHHLEGVYCIEGKATLEDKATGEVHEIRPGTIYLLDDHDQHVLRVEEDLRVICTFNPPVTGARGPRRGRRLPAADGGGPSRSRHDGDRDPHATRTGTDPYPSRMGRPPELLPRVDPVVHGAASRGTAHRRAGRRSSTSAAT